MRQPMNPPGGRDLGAAGGGRHLGAAGGGRQRLHIDWTTCDGRGLCTELLPELLDRDEWGYPLPRLGGDPVIPDDLRDVAEFAVTHCPRLALKLLPINDQAGFGRGRPGKQQPTR